MHMPFLLLQEESMTANEIELKSLKESLQDTQPVGGIVNCCRTLDQVSFFKCMFIDFVFFIKIFVIRNRENV